MDTYQILSGYSLDTPWRLHGVFMDNPWAPGGTIHGYSMSILDDINQWSHRKIQNMRGKNRIWRMGGLGRVISIVNIIEKE